MILLLLLLGIALGGAYYAYRIGFYSPKENRERIPSTSGHQYDPYRADMARVYKHLTERTCEFVTIRSHDGLTLSGRYYHIADGAPLDIGFHGYRSSPLTDFSGGSELCFRMGHNLLLVDQRSHGKSQGSTITFGIKERRDAVSWVNYAVGRFGPEVRITLYGVSMGGATVLMASELDLPKNVKAIVADCPYSSPIEIIRHVGKDMPVPSFLVCPFAVLGAAIFGRFNLLETDAARAVRNAKIPILIIHGEADSFVPCEMSDLVSQNPTLVARHTFPGADHGISYLADTLRYKQIVMQFLEKVLN